VEIGQRVTVTAAALDKSELAYVSGTVSVSGMPVLPLHYDAVSRAWSLSYYIPVFWTIPPGKYEIKAWGETKYGERYEGKTFVEVK
jgi:hypothetical protein